MGRALCLCRFARTPASRSSAPLSPRNYMFLYLICFAFSSASAPYFLTWNGHDKDYFFFEDGAVVCWGASAHDITSLDTLLRFVLVCLFKSYHFCHDLMY